MRSPCRLRQPKLEEDGLKLPMNCRILLRLPAASGIPGGHPRFDAAAKLWYPSHNPGASFKTSSLVPIPR